MLRILILAFCATPLLISCNREPSDNAAQITFEYHFDTLQARLNNIGQAAALPAGHAAQTPDFRDMSIHYIELSQDQFTPLGQGAVLYKGPEIIVDGQNAIDFSKVLTAKGDSIFARYSLKDVPAGTYRWVRVSVAGQRYDFKFNINNLPVLGDLPQQSATISSILGFNNYLTSVTPRTMSLPVNGARKQGFWVFETNLSAPYSSYNNIYSGQAPEGATTVVNPLFATSPVPQGSCVVTGELAEPLVITGDEKEDIRMILSFSINQSVEWIDSNGNGQLDLDAGAGTFEQIVDMGLRGLQPKIGN